MSDSAAWQTRQGSRHLPVPPEALWPWLSSTERLNEAGGFLPRYTLTETVIPDGSVLQIGRTTSGRFDLEWEEEPAEWLENSMFRQRRLFSKGPLAGFELRLALEPVPDGTRVVYTVAAAPATLLGRAWLAIGSLDKLLGSLDRLVREAGEMLADASPADPPSAAFKAPPPVLPPLARERAAAMVRRLKEAGHPLAPRLADHLLEAGALDIERLRPLALARHWGVADRPVIELCLAAVTVGMLVLRWDLLCPRCRGAKISVPSLDQLPLTVHCPSCNIGYGRDFMRNVELVFEPAPTIRPVADGAYCLSGPQSTPHVVVQQVLSPGEHRHIPITLPEGEYRIRTREPGGEVDLSIGPDGCPAIELADAEVRIGDMVTDNRVTGGIEMVNGGDIRRTLVIERRDWIRDALTAHRATTLQAFRDLFATEALRPGDEVGIGQVTLLFTDLKASTALYDRLGDAGAYRLVREHYAALTALVRDHDGAIVKTIGDAVMAAFSEPAAAIRAALTIHATTARVEAVPPLIIKVGLHTGPCIAVTLNDRLDYFGSTVNLAARLQQQSLGGDIILSASLADEPEVAALLIDQPVRRETATVRGFAEPIELVRVMPV
ncbi:MAG TPA: adenylate/guanylate cyclase domain-containing protein [Stellaceae bacterium]|nr:adenylate/guanylate cyclase domain-containing protein [Stellaceae bacterium]